MHFQVVMFVFICLRTGALFQVHMQCLRLNELVALGATNIKQMGDENGPTFTAPTTAEKISALSAFKGGFPAFVYAWLIYTVPLTCLMIFGAIGTNMSVDEEQVQAVIKAAAREAAKKKA